MKCTYLGSVEKASWQICETIHKFCFLQVLSNVTHWPVQLKNANELICDVYDYLIEILGNLISFTGKNHDKKKQAVTHTSSGTSWGKRQGTILTSSSGRGKVRSNSSVSCRSHLWSSGGYDCHITGISLW